MSGPDYIQNKPDTVTIARGELEALRASHAELLDVADQAQKMFAMLTDPQNIKATTAISAWANCVSTEQICRRSIANTRRIV